jgi:hypothetical protein
MGEFLWGNSTTDHFDHQIGGWGWGKYLDGCKEIHCYVWRVMVLKAVLPGSFGANIIEPSVPATILSVGYGLVN